MGVKPQPVALTRDCRIVHPIEPINEAINRSRHWFERGQNLSGRGSVATCQASQHHSLPASKQPPGIGLIDSGPTCQQPDQQRWVAVLRKLADHFVACAI